MDKLTLSTICEGALQEKIERAILQVSENIIDPNTNMKPRTIQLTLKFTPVNEERDEVEVDADVTVKLGAETGLNTRFVITQGNNGLDITEYQSGQVRGQLSFGDNIVSIGERAV